MGPTNDSISILYSYLQATWHYRPFKSFNLVWFVPWRHSLFVLVRALVPLSISRALSGLSLLAVTSYFCLFVDRLLKKVVFLCS